MKISTYTLNHFGIVSATCEELGIAQLIDDLVGADPQQKVTTGKAVVAMIINGLGFSNRRLYLFPQFFENKPLKFLLDTDLTAYEFNDDALGRAFDRSYQYGCTELFCQIAAQAVKIENVNQKFGHLDTTTFSVHGDYDSSQLEGAPVQITYGHSKQKRPDLKQIFLNLLVTADGGIPLFMQTLDGNSSDVTTFQKTVAEFKKGLKKNLQEVTYWVADSAFYCKETLQTMGSDSFWISRVPERIAEAKQVITDKMNSIESLEALEQEGYTYSAYRSQYASIEQRWLIIHSDQAQKRSQATVKREVKKEAASLLQHIKKLNKKTFTCENDAKNILTTMRTKARYHTLAVQQVTKREKYTKRGRPSQKGENYMVVSYSVVCTYTLDQNKIDQEVKKRSIFIIATNELSTEQLSDQEVFNSYKGQTKVERGFRFLKDPLFFASSLFLKKPSRIVALTMVMCLSLLVYSVAERKLRNLLKEQGEFIKNQVGKPTPKPTLRWIFELFEDIHMLKISENGSEHYEVKNIRADGEKALRLLGANYMKPYLL